MSESHPRIALIRRSYRPDGGAERIINRTIAGLREHGNIDVSLICEEWGGSEILHPITVRRRGLGRTAKHRNFVRQVSDILSREGFDLVQSNERIPGCTLYRAGDGVHAQWLQRRASVSSALSRRWLGISRFHHYMVETERAMFTHPDLQCVICNSRMVESDILNHYPVDSTKLRRIYNGIDLQRFTPLKDAHERSALRRQLGLREAPLLLFVGSGFERKGLAQLISAMAMSGGDWQLAVLGRDKHEAHYRKQVARLGLEEKVHFIGVVENMIPYYQCADLLVHPCLYDPFSNVVLEAMACGLGAITNQYNGANELISQEINGLNYDGDNVGALSRALSKAHGHFDDYREAARATAEGYSITKMVDEIVCLYCELLSLER